MPLNPSRVHILLSNPERPFLPPEPLPSLLLLRRRSTHRLGTAGTLQDRGRYFWIVKPNLHSSGVNTSKFPIVSGGWDFQLSLPSEAARVGGGCAGAGLPGGALPLPRGYGTKRNRVKGGGESRSAQSKLPGAEAGGGFPCGLRVCGGGRCGPGSGSRYSVVLYTALHPAQITPVGPVWCLVRESRTSNLQPLKSFKM